MRGIRDAKGRGNRTEVELLEGMLGESEKGRKRELGAVVGSFSTGAGRGGRQGEEGRRRCVRAPLGQFQPDGLLIKLGN